MVWAAVDEDTPELRRWLRSNISGYMFAMQPYRRPIRDNGFAIAVQQLEEAGARGDRDGARNAPPDELLEQTVMFGPLDRVQCGLARLMDAGVDRLLVMSVTAQKDGLAACHHTIEALAPS